MAIGALSFSACDGDGGGNQEQIPQGFVTIPAGTFAMGSTGRNAEYDEIPVHYVTLTSYLICDHEVTQSEYETYCIYSNTSPDNACGKGKDYPVYYVSWYDAVVYCNLRSIAEGLTPCYKLQEETDPKQWTGIQKDDPTNPTKYCGPASNNDDWNKITCDFNANGYRLPTEAEWECAARGGIWETNIDVWAGTKTESELSDYAWYDSNAGSKTHEVGKKLPNGYGLYDMSGNVWEWCWDWYGGDYSTDAATDPQGPGSGGGRVRRGGSWFSYASDCRVAGRDDWSPDYRYDGLGFRVVRSAQ